MQRINKLDGLRGLFAIFVVLFHFNINNAPAVLVNNFFVRESYIFVDFFFILSGYVISLNYSDSLTNLKSLRKFILKRFIRLYPLLLFSTLMYWYYVHPFFNQQNIRLTLDTLLLTNSTPILGSEIGMNYPSWSISSEMISYIIFGICSFIAIKKSKTILITCITIACFAFLAYQGNYFVTGNFGFIRGLACFNLGYFIYFFSNKNLKIPTALECVISICIITLMYLQFTVKIKHPILNIAMQFLIPISFATCIFILIKTNGLLSRLLQTRPLLFLGKISYSVYLNHAFVIGFGMPTLYKHIKIVDADTKKWVCLMILILLLLAYSWATQYVIELQLGKKLRSYLVR